MRSRYSAYVIGAIDYLHETLHPDYRSDHDQAATRRWAEESIWLGLEILATEKGGEGDEDGIVEFVAGYKEKGMARRYHERSRFRREGERWYYVDGEVQRPGTYVQEHVKVGRNDPCPCGSGKKYKKCCGV
jgi:SEC-C motif domain protein